MNTKVHMSRLVFIAEYFAHFDPDGIRTQVGRKFNLQVAGLQVHATTLG